MTLFIAMLIINGFDFHWSLHILAGIIWTVRVIGVTGLSYFSR